MISPIYADLAKKHTGASFIKVDVDDLPDVAQARAPSHVFSDDSSPLFCAFGRVPDPRPPAGAGAQHYGHAYIPVLEGGHVPGHHCRRGRTEAAGASPATRSYHLTTATRDPGSRLQQLVAYAICPLGLDVGAHKQDNVSRLWGSGGWMWTSQSPGGLALLKCPIICPSRAVCARRILRHRLSPRCRAQGTHRCAYMLAHSRISRMRIRQRVK